MPNSNKGQESIMELILTSCIGTLNCGADVDTVYDDDSTKTIKSIGSEGGRAERREHDSLEVLKRDKIIERLTADLKAEKAENKKRGDDLRKYESFYEEMTARSNQKKKQHKAVFSTLIQ